jgi:hypothetical protein
MDGVDVVCLTIENLVLPRTAGSSMSQVGSYLGFSVQCSGFSFYP